jgi:hypothetical protein
MKALNDGVGHLWWVASVSSVLGKLGTLLLNKHCCRLRLELWLALARSGNDLLESELFPLAA